MSNVHTPSEGHDSGNEAIKNLMAELGNIIGEVEEKVTQEELYENVDIIGGSLVTLQIKTYENNSSDIFLAIENDYGRVIFTGRSEGKGKKRKTSLNRVELTQDVSMDKSNNDEPITLYTTQTEDYGDGHLRENIAEKTLLTKKMLQSVIEKTKKLIEKPESSELENEWDVHSEVENQIAELRKAYTAIVGNILK